MLTLHWAGPASRANRKASVDEGDDINNYSVILKKHINRMQVAEKVIAGKILRDALIVVFDESVETQENVRR